ncbi:ComEC/Rec2 family competence protein [Paenibacillus taichungensis]|uniref:ComEC/Rec2 family competence protein n=1 Tax=Paenibacillus taichungensis TaxID=484184 RepID=UPI0039A65ED2
MKGRPLLVFTVCWLCGSGMACALSGWSLIVGMIGAFVCLPLLLRWIDIRGWSILLLIGALVGGAVHWEWNDARNRSSLPDITHMAAEDLDGYAATFEGKLMSDVRIDGDRADFEMQVTSMLSLSDGLSTVVSEARTAPNVRERLMVQVRLAEEEEQQEAAGWQRGDTITLTGSLALPGEARNFGGFDYRNYLRTLHINWLFKVKGASSVTTVPPEGLGKLNILRWNDIVRHKLGAAVEQIFPEPHAGYMKGLIIGMANDIDPDTYGQFSQLGLTHILAISGTHVAVYVASLLLLLSWLRLTRETSLTIVLLLIPAYVLLSGGSPSVVRAGIMSMIGLYMARRGLARDGLQMISAAALLMMWWNPYFLLSVSFQLSFLVTAGLMIYMPLINRIFSSWPKGLAATASVTVTAQLISFPVTILYFNQFSLLSFVANFLLVSLISAIVLPLGTVALILSFLWMPLAKPLAWIAIMLNKLTFVSVEWMNSLPGFVLIWATPSLLWIAAYYAVLYALLRVLNRGRGDQPVVQGTEEDTAPLDRRFVGGTPERALGLSGLSNVSSQGLNKGRREVSPGSMTTLSASIAWPEYTSAFAARGAGFYSGERMNVFHKWMCALLALSFVVGLWWAYQTPQPAGTGVVQFLDIGQGDSTLITTPEGKHILVDGGGTVQFGKSEQSWKTRRDPYEVGAKVVVPLLKKRGIHRLDAVIVTHADQDHAGGLQAVLEQIPVERFMFNGTTSGTANFEKLLDTVIDKRIPLYAIRQGMSYAPDGETRLHFIYPDLEKGMNTGERLPVSEHQNHDSVVFMLEMAGASLLFTGDMDAAAEQDLLYMIQDGSLAASFGQYGADATLADVSVQEMFTRHSGENHEEVPVTIDVLKVAHHGSKTSSTEAWLQYWNASASVISAGSNNTYGHPNPGVLERLVDSGTAIYRTDQMGEIQMKIKDGKIDVRYKLVPNSP